MKISYLSIAVAILAVAAVAGWWLNSPDPLEGGDSMVGRQLLDAGVLSETTWIEVSERDGPAVVMIEEADGWVLPEYFGIPVDFQKISDLAQQLRESQIVRFVTDDPGALERIDLGQARITLKETGGDSLWEMVIGETARSGGHYIGLTGHDGAFLCDSTFFMRTTPAEWAVKQPLQIELPDVAAVTLPFGDDSQLRLTRGSPGEPLSADGLRDGEKLDLAKVNGLLRTVLHATYRDIRPNDDPDVVSAREHARSVFVTTFDGYDYTIRIGRRPEAGEMRSAANEQGRISSSIVFDHEGNIVPDELLATDLDKGNVVDGAARSATDPENESTRSMDEPGPVFIFFESTRSSFRWNEPQRSIALQFDESIYHALPFSKKELLQ